MLLPVRTMARASWSPIHSGKAILIALTDLAFSLDSVTTRSPFLKKTWLVLTGATIGIITLRFWIIHSLAGRICPPGRCGLYHRGAGRLATAAARWLTISEPPEWLMSAIALIFAWVF